MELYFIDGHNVPLPEGELERFEQEYQDWLKSKQPHAEFQYENGNTTHYLRLDAIVRREAKEPFTGTLPPPKEPTQGYGGQRRGHK